MTDRELLRFAAKAAGAVRGDWGMNCYWLDGTEWNPLTDDGDALRLAVKLEMLLDCRQYGNQLGRGEYLRVKTIYHGPNDPYSATRRAIVMAAAEIGKDMK